MKMNPRVKILWTTDLRTARIQQWTKGALGNGKARCCLGVLGDIAVREGIIDPPITTSRGNLVYDDYVSYLSTKVAEWAGIEINGAYLGARGEQEYLARDNDFNGKDFLEIADIIDENF